MTHSRQDEQATAMAAGQPDPGQEAVDRLEALKKRLREHPPLEDLGPLFGPEARGGGPSGGRTR